ncbi:MAG: heavy-metal-associated domain-containing protein [Cyanobacteria bacterium J06641_5]
MTLSKVGVIARVSVIELQVPSIMCDGCVSAITAGIHKQDPNAKVSADVETKHLKVETAVDAAHIRQAILDAGHEVA